MKTFEEALGCCMQRVPIGDPVDPAVSAISDAKDRYREISEEAANSSILMEAIAVWYDHGKLNGAGSALFTAFIAGMVTGIEMEKQGENQT